jgi:hypothetical protein
MSLPIKRSKVKSPLAPRIHQVYRPLSQPDVQVIASAEQGAPKANPLTEMKPHSVFLRPSCILPHYLDPLREPIGDNWTHVEEIGTPVFDTMIRHAGWHFICVQGTCFRRGFGVTRDDATHRAVVRALREVTRQCNAAELDSVQVTKYPGFHVARATVQPRQIQQHTSLGIPEKRHLHVVPAR